ncbi:MAG: Holliday junction branch migration protein RuvA [Candidatus Binataceae bacterium]
MIASLSGRLKLREAGRLVVETAGVGYEIFIPLSTYYHLSAIGASVELEIRHVVRDDAILLYGFGTHAEKQAFDLLMRVQHVGPKLALAILSVLSPRDLVGAISREDAERIDAVPGVGAKVAERIVRELRDKIADLNLIAPEPTPIQSNGHVSNGTITDDAISALINLGYKPAEARRAVDAVGSAGSDGLEVLMRKSLAVLLGEK